MTLVANLLCERDWAAAAAGAAGRPLPPAPPRRLLESLSALGTLLRVLAHEGDTLRTPLPVDPARLPDLPGVAHVVLVAGPCDVIAEGDLAWARPDAAAANHRRVAYELAAARGTLLPGALWIDGTDALERHLAAGGADASPTGAYVLKAPWSAAGRERLRGRALPRGGDARRLEGLLACHGELLFEPWCERTADFGGVARVTAGHVEIAGLHRQELAGGGALRAIHPLDDEPPPHGLAADERRALHEALVAAGEALARRGYAGPFGVDAYRHTARPGPHDRAGRTHFHALGEINARLTFGALARLWTHALARPGASFHVGPTPPADALVLLHPAPPDGVAAWLA